MPRTITTSYTTDLALREIRIEPTSIGYNIHISGLEIDSENGNPVASREKTYDFMDLDVEDRQLVAVFAEAILTKLRKRDYS